MFKFLQFCYILLGLILVPFLLLFILIHIIFRPHYFQAYISRFGLHLPPVSDDNKQNVWIHAVSVGEITSCNPLVTILLEKGYNVYLSTTTPTGYETAKKLFPHVHLFYFPLDYGFIIKRLLHRITPVNVILVEMEFWPSFIYNVNKFDIPIYLVSGRLADKEFSNYKRFRFFFSYYLELFSGLFMQSKDDADKMRQLTSNPKVYVSGSLKFDVTPPDKQYEIVSLLPETPFILAASTHKGEEAVIIQEYKKILDTHPHTSLVIAPRHPHRAAEVVDIARKQCLPVTLRSDKVKAKEGVFIIDTVGELMGIFPHCLLVIMGGTFYSGVGGHNIIEPALFGKCVITGKHMENFRDIFEAFLRENAVITTEPEIIGITVAEILVHSSRLKTVGLNARNLVEKNRGVAGRLFQDIFTAPSLKN